jgi:hypothetical protein
VRKNNLPLKNIILYLYTIFMPIYTDPINNIKYAYSSIGQLDELETAQVISSTGVSGDIIILNRFTINETTYMVTGISDNSFRNCNNITSIVIPPGVTNIGNYAFSSCAKLYNIQIPDSVDSIGSSAFYYCSYLETITIKGSITSIGANTFAGCANLTTITIPDSVTSIGKNAFVYCSNLSSITIPHKVTSIGACAFGFCARLLSVIIPENVTYIGENAFNSCVRLASVRFTSALIKINDRAFDEIASPATAYITPDSQIENISHYFTNIIIMHMPIISSINPNNGVTTASTKVTIIGASLTNIVTVLFGYKKALSVVVVSDFQIDVIVPMRIDSGKVDVTLIDVYNKEFILPGGYTYTSLNKKIDPIEWNWGKEKVASVVKRIRTSFKTIEFI